MSSAVPLAAGFPPCRLPRVCFLSTTLLRAASQVADKNCEKIHYLAPNIHCCGAGTAADTENITQLTASNLELLRRQMGTQSRVVTAMTLLKRRLFQ